ncbi:ankyrin repeat domain-containing protein 49 [Halyomorpha halys]|uniref:ankyrin repeat domain-containing protein 49 n=1 Tax=Halyomorpha halys TaxID=286706 RepID=UPI0006D4D6EC|nr:ankyrin repeat domain-containing protein 49-like [Halyomorpha halys]
MSDEDIEDIDYLSDLPDNFPNADSSCRFQVSGWENDNDGIEEEQNPHESPDKELLWAAENGHLDVVENLLEKDITLLHVTDKDGYTPLHRACYNNHPEIVKYLLQEGAKHDASTVDNWQPLHSACKWNNIECAALLLSHGADINASSKGGVTPLHLAANHSKSDQLLKLFLSHPELIHDGLDSAGDTAYDIARRSGPNVILFEAVEACFL